MTNVTPPTTGARICLLQNHLWIDRRLEQFGNIGKMIGHWETMELEEERRFTKPRQEEGKEGLKSENIK